MTDRFQAARSLTVAAVLLAGCAQTATVAAPERTSPANCRITGQYSWHDAVPDAPVGADLPAGFALIPAGSYTLEGDCVRRARWFAERKIFFDDRAAEIDVAEINSDAGLTFGEPFGFEYVQTVPVGPRIGRSPILAMDVVNGDIRVGVWNINGGWTVASFNGMSQSRPLLRSSAPIVAVDYSTIYHMEGGRLSLIQQLGPTKARLLNYTLKHPGL